MKAVKSNVSTVLKKEWYRKRMWTLIKSRSTWTSMWLVAMRFVYVWCLVWGAYAWFCVHLFFFVLLLCSCAKKIALTLLLWSDFSFVFAGLSNGSHRQIRRSCVCLFNREGQTTQRYASRASYFFSPIFFSNRKMCVCVCSCVLCVCVCVCMCFCVVCVHCWEPVRTTGE